MDLIDQIITELCVIKSDLSVTSSNTVREQAEVTRTMEKAQSSFGDQEMGQKLIISLYGVIQNLICAESSLHALNTKIQEIECSVRK